MNMLVVGRLYSRNMIGVRRWTAVATDKLKGKFISIFFLNNLNSDVTNINGYEELKQTDAKSHVQTKLSHQRFH